MKKLFFIIIFVFVLADLFFLSEQSLFSRRRSEQKSRPVAKKVSSSEQPKTNRRNNTQIQNKKSKPVPKKQPKHPNPMDDLKTIITAMTFVDDRLNNLMQELPRKNSPITKKIFTRRIKNTVLYEAEDFYIRKPKNVESISKMLDFEKSAVSLVSKLQSWKISSDFFKEVTTIQNDLLDKTITLPQCRDKFKSILLNMLDNRSNMAEVAKKEITREIAQKMIERLKKDVKNISFTKSLAGKLADLPNMLPGRWMLRVILARRVKNAILYDAEDTYLKQIDKVQKEDLKELTKVEKSVNTSLKFFESWKLSEASLRKVFELYLDYGPKTDIEEIHEQFEEILLNDLDEASKKIKNRDISPLNGYELKP